MRFELFVFVFFILLLSRLLYAELFAQAFHSFACSALEVLEVLSAYAHRRFGVDEVYGCRGAHIVDEARSRVYVERCAYNDEDVGCSAASAATLIIGTDSPKNTMNGRSSDPSPASVPGFTSQLSSVRVRW